MKINTKIASLIASGVLGLVVGGVIVSSLFQPVYAAYGSNRMNMQSRSLYNTSIAVVEPLTDSQNLQSTLTFLIEDEYKARAEYVALVEKFGEVAPFVNLIKAETKHINALVNQFNLYGLEIPADNGSEFAVIPTTLAEAYAIGIQAETSNIALYENFLKQDLPVSVVRTFTNLMNASVNHLATFEAYQDGTAVGTHITTSTRNQINGRRSIQK